MKDIHFWVIPNNKGSSFCFVLCYRKSGNHGTDQGPSVEKQSLPIHLLPPYGQILILSHEYLIYVSVRQNISVVKWIVTHVISGLPYFYWQTLGDLNYREHQLWILIVEQLVWLHKVRNISHTNICSLKYILFVAQERLTQGPYILSQLFWLRRVQYYVPYKFNVLKSITL